MFTGSIVEVVAEVIGLVLDLFFAILGVYVAIRALLLAREAAIGDMKFAGRVLRSPGRGGALGLAMLRGWGWFLLPVFPILWAIGKIQERRESRDRAEMREIARKNSRIFDAESAPRIR